MTRVQERNQLLAEFDGKKSLYEEGKLLLSYNEGQSWYGVLYDKDWSALMPLVEKIEGLGYKFQICGRRATVKSDDKSQLVLFENKRRTKIGAVHLTAAQFCKWYKSQKP